MNKKPYALAHFVFEMPSFLSHRPPASGDAPGRPARRLRAFRRAPVPIALLTAALAVGLAATSVPAGAQEVRGRLVAESTGEPVQGAMVSLRDEAGERRAAAFTGPDGGFVLEAPAPGAYRVRAQRIGFRTWMSPPVEVSAGETVRRTFRVSMEPVSLRDLEVTGERRCGTPAVEGEVVARVWEEASKALEAARVSGERGMYEFTVRAYDRELDARARRVREESSHTYTARTNQPFMSPPPGELAASGYVRGSVEEGRTYYAPDLSTLLSDTFFDTHCFRVEREGGAGLLALRFEPGPGREVPEIRGRLWVEEGTGELRHMEYDYVNLGVDVNARATGGRLEFRRLPSGAWVIRRWWIRMPVMAARRAWWDERERRSYELQGIHETGREIAQIRTPEGRLLYDLERATLVGTVRDSTRGVPLEGAVVRVAGTEWADTTGADGRFRITGLPEGRYSVDLRHPRLDSLGIVELPARDARLAAGELSRVALAVPSWTSLLAASCEAEGTHVVGRVRERGAELPLSGVRVTVGKPSAGGAPPDSSRLLAQTVTDARGHFRFCALPPSGSVSVRASYLGATADSTVSAARGGAVRADLGLAVATRAAVVGRAVDAETGKPIRGAEVRLGAGEASWSAVTDEEGRFRMTEVERGRHPLRVDHSAYPAVEDTLRVEPGVSLSVSVRLASDVVPVEPLRVEVEREGRERVQGLGVPEAATRAYVLSTAEVDSLRGSVGSVESLLRRMRVPGLSVRELVNERNPVDRSLCVELARQRGGRNPRCNMVQVRVDGALVAEPMTYLENLDVESVERVELIPPTEAGARFGTGSETGVLLVYTRQGEAR